MTVAGDIIKVGEGLVDREPDEFITEKEFLGCGLEGIGTDA